MTDLAALATLRHGPSTPGPSATVGACLLLGLDETDPLRLALEARAAEGQAKYGTGLSIGWPHARAALLQELLDALVYAAAAGDEDIVRELGGEYGTIRRLAARMGAA